MTRTTYADGNGSCRVIDFPTPKHLDHGTLGPQWIVDELAKAKKPAPQLVDREAPMWLDAPPIEAWQGDTKGMRGQALWAATVAFATWAAACVGGLMFALWWVGLL